ncbi:CSLREA domain-containing protein [Alcanivorax sp. IO_7]|nr:CSLREA domain-containing protein [Alcanivorax sp. IO_7]
MTNNKGTAPGRRSAGRLGRALFTAGLLGLASLAQALTLTVNSTEDSTGGDCQGGGVCTLRQAVTEANAIPESSEALVTIAIPAGTYTLGATLVIERAMTLVGGGGDQDADPAATILQAGTSAGRRPMASCSASIPLTATPSTPASPPCGCATATTTATATVAPWTGTAARMPPATAPAR